MKNSKKLVNLISLVVLVATNILSPLSYVTAEDDLDIGDAASYGAEQDSGGDSSAEAPNGDQISPTPLYQEGQESPEGGDEGSSLIKEGDHEVVEDLDVDVADAYSDSDEGDVETTPQPSAAPLTGSETPEDDLPLCEERGTACGGGVDSGTGEFSAIDMLKDAIEALSGEILTGNIELLTGENLTGEVLTGDVQELTGQIQELTGAALELATARETLNSDLIEKSEKYNSVTVNVKAQPGTFPENTKLHIEAIKGNALEEVRQQIADEPTNNVDEYAEIVAFDITFTYELSDGTEIEVQPKDGESVQVTFDYSKNKELKAADKDDSQQIEIYHINDKDENGEKVTEGEEVVEKVEINQEKSEEIDNALVIDAESFSVYAVTVNVNDHTYTDKVYYSNTDEYKTATIEGNGITSFTYGTITIKTNGDDIVMMDRNLGATDRWNISDADWNWNDYTAPTTYGYHYQWGNNYGFLPSSSPSTSPDQVARSGDGFSSSTWITTNPWNTTASTSDVWTQGPCPAGWHVPSNTEWQAVYDALDAGADGKGMAEALLLPPAGDRNYYNANVRYVGSLGYYWSSTPLNANRAYRLSFSSSDISPQFNDVRALGFAVRCFRNSPITITFNLNGGYWTEEGSTSTSNKTQTYYGGEGSLTDRKTPSKVDGSCDGKKCMFDGWYTDQAGTTRWTGDVSSSITVYAKWLPFEDWTIPGTDYVIMDRNLGATSAYGECTTSNTATCGYHFQWGNNYGFKHNGSSNTFPNGETATTTKATDVSNYSASTYYSPKFIYSDSRWSTTDDYNLWGGQGDSTSAEGDATTDADRQGPCPGGYHVPSTKEWRAIYDALSLTSSADGVNQLKTKLNLPPAGYRNYNNANVLNVGSNGYYWSSTPYNANGAYRLRFDSSNINPQDLSNRANGFAVRCLKNSPQIFTITLNANGGELEGESSLTTDNEGKVTLPRATREPNENGERVFEGWFASTGLSEKIGNSGDIITLAADMDVYAHWAQTITIRDPANPLSGFTIMDRNLGAATTGYGADASTDSYGFHYQWGNNYGFDPNIDPSELPTSSVKVNVDGLTSYYSGVFITTNKSNENDKRHDTWMETNNNNLWNGDKIQGPCPEGWHIPSHDELNNLLIYWAKSNNVTWTTPDNSVKINSSHLKISNDLYIPYAGARNYDGSFLNRGNLGIFWSYSINGSNGLPYDFFTSNIDGTYVRNNDGRIRGLSIRCFKNEYVAPSTSGTTATLLPGSEFNVLVKNLSKNSTGEDIRSYNGEIEKIYRSYRLPEALVNTGLISTEDSQNEIIAWFDDSDDEGILYYYTQADTIYMNSDSSNMFEYFAGLKDTLGIRDWDTSNVTNMSSMFDECGSLEEIDLSKWNTNNVTDMNNMFYNCWSLEKVDLSNWNTNNVTDMSYMFSECGELKIIYASSGFIVKAGTNSNFMFGSYSEWTSYYAKDLVGGNGTKNYGDVTDGTYAKIDTQSQSGYFTDKKAITVRFMVGYDEFDVGEVKYGNKVTAPDTSTLEGFSGWYYEGEEFDFDSTNILKYTELYAKGVQSQDTILLSGEEFNILVKEFVNNSEGYDVWDNDNKIKRISHSDTAPGMLEDTITISVENSQNEVIAWFDDGTLYYYTQAETIYMNPDSSYMFMEFGGLIDLSGINDWNASKVTNMGYMFYDCWNLEELDLNSWDVSNVVNMESMFSDCSSLVDISGIRNWNIMSVTNMSFMFAWCEELVDLSDIRGWNTSKVVNMSYMFYVCNGLINVDLSNWNTSSLKDASDMFSYCENLKNINLGNWNTKNLIRTYEMFYNLDSLKTLDLSKWNMSNVMNTESMFLSVPNLTTVYASSGFIINSKVESGWMFDSENLVGGNGTKFDWDFDDGTYAKIDNQSQSGYFTDKSQITVRFKIGTGIYTDQVIEYGETPTIPSDPDIGKDFIKWVGQDSIEYDFSSPVYEYTEVYAKFSGGTEAILLPGKQINVIIKNLAGQLSASYDTKNTTVKQIVKWTGNIPSGVTTRIISEPYSDIEVMARFTGGILYYSTQAETIYMNSDSSNLFREFTALTGVDIRDWNTSNVTDMSFMFDYCESLGAIDVSNFNTSNVTNMNNMFYRCFNIKSLDVSNFDTRNVTSMRSMFAESHLTSLDLSSFETYNLTDMYYMFGYSNNLVIVDMSRFDTSNVTNMNDMFRGSPKVKTIYASSGFVVNSGTKFDYMLPSSLIGGNGTKYNFSNNDRTYIRIDTQSQSGYFTDKNEITVRFMSGENVYADVVTSYGSGVSKPADPEGYNITWYYTGMQDEFDFDINKITEYIELYGELNIAACPAGEEYVESKGKCLPSRAIIRDSVSGKIIQINDMEWDDLELYFLRSDGSTGHYTIMDRNMGATEVYNQNQDDPNFESLGYHYQRGNNYGFKPCEGNECSTFPGGETAGNIVIEKSVWEAYAPSKYARNTWSTAENWMGGAGDNDNLRGGAGDEQLGISSIFSSGPGTGGDRQGPCPDEYHIPSAYEWGEMYKSWEDSVYVDMYLQGDVFGKNFLLPSVGYRSYSNEKITNRFIAKYRSSSPWSDSDANELNVNGYGPGVFNQGRSDGLSLRCMRNTNKSETLKIHANGGTETVIAFTGSVSNGRFTTLGTPRKENSVFTGWYDAEVGGNKLGTGSAVVSDIYARWECDSHSTEVNGECVPLVTVTFDSNGGSEIDSQVIISGNLATQPATNPTRDNSVFKWWYLEDSETAFDFEHTAITGNITLNAKWECAGGYIEKGETCVESVLVSFNTNGGTPKQSVEIEKGTKLKGSDVKYSHTSNIDDGGNSNGNYEEDLKMVDVIKIPGSERLYIDLKYATQTNYDVLLVIEGEYNDSSEEPPSKYYVFHGNSDDTLNTTGFYISGDTVTFLFYSDSSSSYYGYYAAVQGTYDKIGANPTNENGEFIGWYLSGSDTLFDTENTEITENTMLYAKWDCNSGYTEVDGKCVQQFTVTLNASQNGGTIDGQGTKALTVASGSTFVRSSYTGQKAGYTFVGWAETSGTTGVLTSNPVITANKELFAVFKKDLLATFIIQDLDAATKAGGSTSCTLYNLDESCSITSPTLNANEGYTALGWNTNSGDTVSSLNSDTSTGISVNATYYSITRSNDKVLHISYTKGIGVEEIGETSDSCTLTGTYNGALQATSCIVTLPEIILRSGYGTGIWTKNTDSLVTKKPGDNIALTSNDSYTASATVTIYPIIYHENGGTLVGQKTSYTVEEDFTLVTPNRDSYVFEGWTGSNGDNPQKTVTVNSGTVTGPLNYYANWTPITYTIAFNGNAVNVEGTQSSIDAIYDSGDTAPESNFTRPGYTFTSWNTQSDGNGINYDTGSELKNLTNTSGDVVTLYAIWQANTDTPYTVHYYLENIDDENYTFDSTDGKAGTTDDEISIDTLKKEITGAHFEKAAVVVSNQGPEYGATTTVDNITISGDGNTEVYLFYKRNTHTVTAIAGEGVGSVSGAGTYKYGQTVTLTPGNINSCYTASSRIFTMPDNDVQETLNGVIKKFTVTLNKDSHISSVQGAGEYNCGVEVNVSATPNVGYEFVRWEKNSTQVSTQSSYTFTITESVVLNAVSKAQNGITYTVRHWIRDIGANTYAKYSEESKSGETDSPITLENEKISVPCGTYAEGKENGTVKTTTTIKGDGSTVIDLYYGRNSYTVTTSKDSGIQSISNSASHECGADVTITATPKTGYSFARWNSEDVASSTSNLYTFTMPDKAVSIQAQSNANTYTVNFNANGGTGTMSQQTFTYDISQQLSDNLFTRTGYIFTGWSIDSGATVPTYTNKQSVDNLATTGSITLYAIWTTKGTSTKYTVRHIKQGLSTPTDDVVETQELYAETNSVQTPAVNTYSGFNSPSVGNITVSANGNASIDYVYTRKNITLTLDKDNGTQNSTITGKYGANVQKPTSNPSKSGYTFAGWLPNIPDTFPAISGTHVAQYTLDTYTITYNLNGGINHADNPTSYTYLSGNITLKAPTRDGYVFNGWMGTDVNSVTKTVIISTHSEGNRSYTAIWGEDRNNNGVDDNSEQKYTVTINYVYSRGGTAASSVSGMYLSGIGFSFTSPVIQNYTPNSGTVTGTGKEEAQTFTVTYTPNHDTNGNGIADEDETSPTSSGGGSSGGGGGGGGGGNKWNPKTQEKDIHGSADVNVDPIGDEGEKSEDTNSQDSNSSTNNVDGQNKSDSADSSNKDNSSQNGYSEEFNQAYSFAYSKGITTVSTIKAANLNSPLTRIQMAKMLSYFAINVLGKDPDTTKKVKFRDVSVAKDKQYDNGVTLAYQLGIMGINMKNDKFRPNDAVTRAEFVTALSRLLYNMSDGEYKGTSKYYEPHMKKLYNEGIITKTNPKMGENRGYVMIMLMRSAKGSVK